MAERNNVLECSGVTIRFGGVVALDQVDFHICEGTITAIIGPNGAGKTTLLNAVSGLYGVNDGFIAFDGDDLTQRPAWRRGRSGVVRTFQNLEIFSNMTVLENVMTGRHRQTRYSFLGALLKSPAYFAEEKRCRDAAMKALEFVGLAEKANDWATELPFGNQRLLELARALAAEPRLLLLDEPAAGLNMSETRNLGNIIRRIRDDQGITVALVEHDMDLVMEISDEILVLSFGKELARGTPSEIQRNPDVIAAYLGEDDEEPEENGQEVRA